MKQQELTVICLYSEEGDIASILEESFRIFLEQELSDERNSAYPAFL